MAIVGRPNVGKSTLFNRLTGRRQAIVEDVPGVTRDRLYAPVEWRGRRFHLVDTGGLDVEAWAGLEPRPGTRDGGGEARPEDLAAATQRQVRAAVAEADVIIFLVDGKAGLHPGEEEIAGILRRSRKPVIVAVNKIDRLTAADRAYEFYALGLGEPIPVSAEHGLNTGDLLDRVLDLLPAEGQEPGGEDGREGASAEGAIRVAVVGRPNVGKSSLVNRLLGEERVTVSDVPGTTRDAVDVRWEADGHVFILVDTAGLRRRARVDTPLEYYSVVRTLRAIDRSDVVLLLLDPALLVTEQDKKIAGYAHEQGKASIIVVNKWDLVDKDERTAAEVTARIREGLAFLSYAPVITVSARTGQRLQRLPGLIAQVAANHAAHLDQARLEAVIADAQAVHAPPGRKGRHLRIHGVAQTGTRPPTFAFFVNDPALVHYSYERYLENRLREAFDLAGTPLRLRWRAGRRRATGGGRARGGEGGSG